ncbi:MAG: hypothetical protein C0456_14080 [Hyphomonas sp.]|nr:hypothetical protein [Hyphomonas sp.]
MLSATKADIHPQNYAEVWLPVRGWVAVRQEAPPGRLPVQEGNQVARIAIGDQAVEKETGTMIICGLAARLCQRHLGMGGNAGGAVGWQSLEHGLGLRLATNSHLHLVGRGSSPQTLQSAKLTLPACGNRQRRRALFRRLLQCRRPMQE